MDELTIFYKPGACSLASMIVAEWSHIPYQLCRVDGIDLESPAYLSINPLGEVPALIHGSQILSESFAILQYLGRQNLGSRLTFHPSTFEFDKMNQVLSFLVTRFHQSFSPLFDPDIDAHQKKKQVDLTIRENFEYVETYLIPKGLIFGQRTIADAYLFATARWGKKLFDIPEEFPRLSSFMETMNQNDGVQFSLSVEKNLISQSTGNFRGHIELSQISKSLGNQFPGLQIRRGIVGTKSASVMDKRSN